LKSFFEQMYFLPKWYHIPLMGVMLPLSFIYGTGMYLRRKFTLQKSYGIPIVSIGNLIVGGAGKTPFAIEVASKFENVCIISRGYGRKSSGLVEVSYKGEILANVKRSGDEPMLMALSLPNASVIVSEERNMAIRFAKKRGASLIILDDGFNRVNIEKFDILLEPKNIANYFPFPSGPFREFYFTKKYANLIAKEEKTFMRKVYIENSTQRMVLVTAISNPQRLDRFLPEGVIDKVYYDDHAYFDEKSLKELLDKYEATSILCTSKDSVKMKNFTIPISEMKLKLIIDNDIMVQIEDYIKQGT